MMTADEATVTRLNTRGVPLHLAYLYTIEPQIGSALYWTNHDLDLTVGGHTYLRGNGTSVPKLSREAISRVAGTKTGSFKLTLHTTPTCLYGGIPLAAAAANGVFKGARFRCDKLFMAHGGDVSVPPVEKTFIGWVADTRVTMRTVELEIRDAIDRLNVVLPRNVYQPRCLHTLGDAGCQIDLTEWQVTGTCDSNCTRSVVLFTSMAGKTSHGVAFASLPTTYWYQGVINFTSGALIGRSSVISAQPPSTSMFLVPVPLPSAPAAGVTFTITPGCDRNWETCVNRFSNSGRYRGFPFVPAAVSVL